MTLWLAGMMGSGKTSSGGVAAAHLGVSFFDTDVEVTAGLDCTVSELWERVGESTFREMESAAVRKLAGLGAIVATGGGAILQAVNRDAMTASGPIVWLQASPEEILERVGATTGRPLLDSSPDRLEELRKLSTERAGIYAEVADHVIVTSGKSVAEVADEIELLWEL
jgi:shikimate kinase